MISTFKHKWKFRKFRKIWRKLNKHNDTHIGRRVFNPEIVKVGSYSYGALNVYSYNEKSNDKLVIGNYVSIAEDVKFFLGANHQLNSVTTFPLRTKLIGLSHMDAINKGPLVIEDEVWIGANSLLFSGITIGKGSIIAAGSIVTKSVEPYTIVGGNPAKKIRNRFEATVINKLMQLDLIAIQPKLIRENIDLFYADLRSIKNSKILDDISKLVNQNINP